MNTNTVVKRIINCLFWILVFSFYSGLSYADRSESEHLKMSALFFPESIAWMPLSEMKKLDADALIKIKLKLKMALVDNEYHKNHALTDCFLVEKLLSDKNKRFQSFYIHDLNADSFPDVIYSGNAFCSEGDITIIWFGNKNDYTIEQNSYWPVKLLRIQPQTLNTCTVAVGCCDSQTDEYHSGSINNIRRYGIRRITKYTDINTNQNKPAFFKSNNRLILRQSPIVTDSYDRDTSDWADLAIFGNVLSKYLPGCSGSIAGQHHDTKSRLWYFVTIDPISNPLRFHAPYDVNAGWVESKQITHLNQ